MVHINRNYGQNEMTLKQSWFLVNPLNKVSPAEYNQYRWWVPLTFTNQKELNFDIESQVTWLRPEQNERNETRLFYILSYNTNMNSYRNSQASIEC